MRNVRNRTLRLIAEVGLATLLGWLTFSFCSERERPAGPTPPPAASGHADPARAARPVQIRSLPIEQPATAGSAAIGGVPSSEQRREASRLDEPQEVVEREILNATTQSMELRGDNPTRCFAGVEVLGPQKLRFEIDVHATRTGVRAGSWRFVEITEGHALPTDVGDCVAAALGGGYVIESTSNKAIPPFDGTISTTYRIGEQDIPFISSPVKDDEP